MKALGMKNDEEIFQAALGELLPMEEPFVQTMKHLLNVNLEECVSKKLYPPEGILTTEDALLYLEKKFATGQAKEYRQRKVDGILDRSLLPHLGDAKADRLKKALYLARMARTVLELNLKVRGEDDKDHYANKRLKLAGDLMEDLFRVAFTLLLKDLKYQLERSFARKKDLRIASAIRPDLLTQRLVHALATGNWVGGRAGRQPGARPDQPHVDDLAPPARHEPAHAQPAALRGARPAPDAVGAALPQRDPRRAELRPRQELRPLPSTSPKAPTRTR